MNQVAALLALVALLASATAWSASSRLLLQDSTFRISVAETMDCHSPVDVQLTTRDPALLDADTGDVQRILDASLAMLRYHCPGLSRINVRGALEGLNQDAFIAALDGSNDWLVEPRQTFQLDVSGQGRYGGYDQKADQAAPSSELMVAGLFLGMSRDMAREALSGNFDSESRLLDNGERLVVEENGCRVERNWANLAVPSGSSPGWRCLQAWFTRGNDPRLYHVDYAEVVDGNRLDDAADQLVGRYGPPGLREDLTWSRNQPTGLRLAWGAGVTVRGDHRRTLQAEISPSAQRTLLQLSLHEPSLASTQGFRF